MTTKLIIMINRTLSAANSHRKHERTDSQHSQLHLHVGDREEVLPVNVNMLYYTNLQTHVLFLIHIYTDIAIHHISTYRTVI